MNKLGKDLIFQENAYLKSYSPLFVFCLPEVRTVFEDPKGRLIALKEFIPDFSLN
ncbi:hypothetical protein [Cecembia calidifontis]|uniref:Uncharacterized protein n=1 Tax=Cecembia calidifontis TaxID=1187080 RepID=A0A4Q7P708_9BACT|nr:hypothetical protein [Cecembia calidifontis]RZS95260.1 hypothetical protein BC751_0779 [Cecembia calidifontis]